jgi:ABC-type branched-subunit amino acid transport system substrate-binding protein
MEKAGSVGLKQFLNMGAALALLGGCGGDDPESGQMELALVTSRTGTVAGVSQQMENSTLLGLRDINAGGGILGKKVALKTKDDNTDPAQAKVAAQEFINEHFDLILGPVTSGSGLAMLEVTVPAQTFLLSPSTTSTSFSTFDHQGWFARTVATQKGCGSAAAQVAYDRGGRKAGILAIKNAAEQDRANAFVERFQSLGAEVIDRVDYPSPPPAGFDYAGTLDQLFSKNPDVVFIACFQTDGIEFLNAWKAEGGFTGAWYVADGLMDASVASTVGVAQTNGITGTTFARPDNAAYKYFLDSYVAAYDGNQPGTRSAEAYDAAILVALAMTKAKSTKAADWRNYLREVANPPGEVVIPGEYKKAVDLINSGADVNYEGAAGSVDIDAVGDVAAPIGLWEFRDGKIQSLGFYSGT